MGNKQLACQGVLVALVNAVSIAIGCIAVKKSSYLVRIRCTDATVQAAHPSGASVVKKSAGCDRASHMVLKYAPPWVRPELLMNWLFRITLTESAWDTAPPDCAAVLEVKLDMVMCDWLPESISTAPPA